MERVKAWQRGHGEWAEAMIPVSILFLILLFNLLLMKILVRAPGAGANLSVPKDINTSVF